jgi:hypothetical protein
MWEGRKVGLRLKRRCVKSAAERADFVFDD